VAPSDRLGGQPPATACATAIDQADGVIGLAGMALQVTRAAGGARSPSAGLLAVLWQSAKAAGRNPAETLHYE